MTINEVIKRINTELFMEQKEWLAKQVAELEPSGTESSALPEGILQFMDLIQNAAEEELGMCFDREELEETDEVTEWCSECEREATLKWNVAEDGLHTFCPYCGKKLMLCTYCPKRNGGCDYDSSTESCSYNNQKFSKNEKIIKHYNGFQSVRETLQSENHNHTNIYIGQYNTKYFTSDIVLRDFNGEWCFDYSVYYKNTYLGGGSIYEVLELTPSEEAMWELIIHTINRFWKNTNECAGGLYEENEEEHEN